ncbi:MAG: carboxypeptidase-like regulatory domain-containing protein, partial [Bacteroidota bacterium]
MKKLSFVIVLLWLWILPAAAQQIIYGTVTDSIGVPVRGVTVYQRDTTLQSDQWVARTNAAGEYAFAWDASLGDTLIFQRFDFEDALWVIRDTSENPLKLTL